VSAHARGETHSIEPLGEVARRGGAAPEPRATVPTPGVPPSTSRAWRSAFAAIMSLAVVVTVIGIVA
jgi:hypothetical protein